MYDEGNDCYTFEVGENVSFKYNGTKISCINKSNCDRNYYKRIKEYIGKEDRICSLKKRLPNGMYEVAILSKYKNCKSITIYVTSTQDIAYEPADNEGFQQFCPLIKNFEQIIDLYLSRGFEHMI